jgi:exopolyphosphatase / guanosine-5'-triphosphate,3'-diphosphate pyrophosphatase
MPDKPGSTPTAGIPGPAYASTPPTATNPPAAGAPGLTPAAFPIISVIDVGASGIRMLLAELHPDGQVRTLEQLERPLALGRETLRTGTLSAASIQKAVNILRQYRALMDTYGVTHTRAVATSAVRGALNRDTFVDRIFLATGIEIEVIEGSQETLLTFAAVQRALQGNAEVRSADALMFHIGGGATECALVRHGEVVASVTMDVGTVRMREMLRSTEMDRRAKTRLIQHSMREMMNSIHRALPFERVSNLIAVGAEARFAARVLTSDPHLAKDSGNGVPGSGLAGAIGGKELRKLADQLLTMTADQIAASYGVASYDADSLAPALLAYAELVRLNQAERLLVPRVTTRDGLVLQMAKSIQSGSSVFFPEQTRAAAVNLARKFHADERHGVHTAVLASAIFEATRSQHKMGDRELLLLEVASILHDIGGFVAARGHHRHAYYLLTHSEVFGLSGIDMEIVANVARYHRRSGPQSDHPAYAALPRPARVTVNRLSGILRVADALDKGHNQRVQEPKIYVSGDELRIEVRGAEDLALERLALDSKSGLFEEVFGLKPVLTEAAPE